MTRPDEDDTRVYEVVRNIYGQYSIFPYGREVPVGWEHVGRRGSKKECLDHIEDVWTDMTPSYVSDALHR